MLSVVPVLKCVGASSDSTNSKNASTGPIHTLCIEEVLSALFKFFTFSELKKFRLVCRAWEKEARHALLAETRKWKLAPLILNREWGNNISRYLEVVARQDYFFHFTKLHLVGIVYDPRKSTIKTSKLIRLLSIIGPSMTSLHLKYIVIKGKFGDFVTFFNLLQELCPNLEKLVLQNVFTVKETVPEHCRPKIIRTETINIFEKVVTLYVTAPVFSRDRDDFDHELYDNFMRHIFKMTPNVEKLKYYDRKDSPIRQLECITNSMKEGNLLYLHTLVMDSNKSDILDIKQLDILKRLTLRSLEISLDAGNINPETSKQSFNEFMELQSPNLVNLKICYDIKDMTPWEGYFAPACIFPNLQVMNIPFQNFTFGLLKLVPILKKLVLRKNPKSACWIEEASDPDSSDITLETALRNWITETKNSNYANHSITELKCEFVVDEMTMELYAQKFKKLVSLEFGFLNEDVMLVVYQHFRDLKNLSVACPPAMYVSSRAYLGESKNVALTESRRAGFKLEVDSHTRVSEQIRTCRLPSILWLKGLQRLELRRFGSINIMNRTHHSIECSSGFMFGVSALQNVTDLKLHPFIHKRAVMSLQLMPSLRRLWTVPLIIGSREGGGRKNFPTTAYWYQVLLRKRPDLKIYVTTSPTQKEQDNGNFENATRLLQVNDVYRGNATSSGLFVYLDEYYIYQDGCEVLRDPSPERRDSLLPCLMT